MSDTGDILNDKMYELEDVSNRLEKLLEASKDLRKKKNALSEWIKGKLEKKAQEDDVSKVQAVLGKSVYTVIRKKKFKNRAPTQREIPKLLEQFFTGVDFDTKEFIVLSPLDKSKKIHDHIWGNRGFSEKTTITRRKG